MCSAWTNNAHLSLTIYVCLSIELPITIERNKCHRNSTRRKCRQEHGRGDIGHTSWSCTSTPSYYVQRGLFSAVSDNYLTFSLSCRRRSWSYQPPLFTSLWCRSTNVVPRGLARRTAKRGYKRRETVLVSHFRFDFWKIKKNKKIFGASHPKRAF